MTYAETFPVGSRVTIHAANEQDGTDHLWHRHNGTVKVWHGNSWASVQMDQAKRGWRQPVIIVGDHLRAALSSRADGSKT